MTKPSEKKGEKSILSKIEDIETQVAFAESGELYSPNQQKTSKKGSKEKQVCVDGETSSGRCTECGK